MDTQREKLGSRIGFLLLSAGCAIGLGNIWRFPYICGANGGAVFVLFYLLFLAILGFPIMLMELSVGRAGKAYMPGAFHNLQPADSKLPWAKTSGVFYCLGNFMLMMFYFIVTGWLFYYTYSYMTGHFSSLSPEQVPQVFTNLLGSWKTQFTAGGIALILTIAACISGLKNSIERLTKILMAILFLLMIAMAVRALTLPGAGAGLAFFLKPNLAVLQDSGKLLNAIHAAMTQSFFTLSLGVGSIAIFGSYVDKEHSLAKEATIIICLDTFVAICAGLILFPCCSSFGISVDAGPGLIFITLPRSFMQLPHGNLAGSCFFLFLSIAAFTTLIAVTENLIAGAIDGLGLSRVKGSLLVGAALAILCMPCALGFNLWSNFHPLGGSSNILDLEDFIVSDNALPLGALLYCTFCTWGFGWGSKNWLTEVNTGKGLKLSPKFLPYCKYILPLLILAIWIIGLAKRF